MNYNLYIKLFNLIINPSLSNYKQYSLANNCPKYKISFKLIGCTVFFFF